MLSLLPRFSLWPVPRLGNDVGPGPQSLAAGSLSLGWYGEVSAAELVSGTELAATVGLTSGVDFNSAAGWLKFAYLGKILFIAKRPFRHTFDLSSLAAADIEDGGRRVILGSHEFKIRLIEGGNANPAVAPGREWNDLIYRVHKDDPTNTRWANYTDTELGTVVDSLGGITTCQETRNFAPWQNERLTRGGYPTPLTGDWAQLVGQSTYHYGWRPVLEYVGPVISVDAALYAQYRFMNGEAINEVTEQFAALSGSATVSDNKLNSTNAAGNLVGETVVFAPNEDFTIDMRHLCTAYSANMSLLGVWAGAGAGTSRWYILYEPGVSQYRFYYRAAGAGAPRHIDFSRSAILNTETHIAVTRKGSTMRLFIDGIKVAEMDEAGGNDATTLGLESSLSTYFAGWKSNIRVFRGKCLYEADFTPPSTLSAAGKEEFSEADNDAMVALVALRRDAMVNEVDGAPILTTTTCRVANSRINTISQTSSRFTIPLPKKFGVGNWTIDLCVSFSAVTSSGGAILLGQWYNGGEVHVDNRWCLHVTNTRALTLRLKRSSTANDVVIVNGPTLALNMDYRIVAECIAGTVTLKVFEAQTGAEVSSSSEVFAQDIVGATPFWAGNRADGSSTASAMKIWNIVLANKALYNGNIVFKPALPKLRERTFYSPEELANLACQFTGRDAHARDEVSGSLITTSGTGTVNNQRLVTTQVNTSRWYLPCQSFSAGDFTIELDLKLLGSSGASTRPIFGQFRGAVGPNSWIIYTLGTNLAFKCGAADLTGISIDSAVGPAQYRSLSSTTEYHVVIQRVNGVISMYIDGTLIGTANFNKEFVDISAYPYITNLYDLSTAKFCASEIRNVRIARQAMYPSGVIVKAPFKQIKVAKPSLYMGHNGLSSVMQGAMENLNYLNQWQSAGTFSHKLFRDVRDPQNVKVVRLLCLIYERSYTVLGWRTLPDVAPSDDMPQFTNTLKIAGGSNLVLSAAPSASVNNGEGKYWSGNMFGTVAMGRHVPFEFV